MQPDVLRAAGAPTPPALTHTYLPIPPQLLADLRDQPRAVGVYALLARLYLIHHTPIPLSAGDLCLYDPSLSYGAARRALQRLVAGGWLIETAHYKNHYRPTWGRTRAGEMRPWTIDARALGCPTHTVALRVDRRLLDIAMGRLDVHDAQPAHPERYLTTPLLTLHDVGAYMLCLGGWATPAPTLERLGFIRSGQAQPLPDDGQLLALASQQALNPSDPHGVELTTNGLRKLGVTPATPAPAVGSGAALFFVAPGVIGHVIDPLIATPITDPTVDETASSASVCGKTPPTNATTTMPGSPGISENTGIHYPPTPQEHQGSSSNRRHMRRTTSGAPTEHTEAPDSPMVQALHNAGADPKIIRELAPHPVAWFEAAIAYTRTCPNAHDPLALAIALVRNKIADPQYRIPAPRARRNEPIDWAAVAAQQGWRTDDEAPAAPCEPPPFAAPPTPVALDPLTLTTLVRARLPQALRGLLDHVTIDSHATAVVLRCTTPTVQQAVERTLIPIAQDVLRQRGDPRPIQPAADSTHETPADVDTTDGQPEWISLEQWAILPRMLRAALRGAQVIDGEIQGVSPALTRLLQTRYAQEVQRIALYSDLST